MDVDRMTAKDVLRKLISQKWSLIETHEEREGDKFSLTGTLIHDINGQYFRFDFHSNGDGMRLDLIEKRGPNVVSLGPLR